MSNFMDYLNATGLVNKIKTILDKKQVTIQFSTMPTASAEYEGQIVQFTGTTDNDYTNGYWYKCEEITPSTTPKTYHWVRITHEVDNDTLHEDANGIVSVDSKYKKIWEGTHADWDLLTTAEKIVFDVAHFTDDAPTAEIAGYQKKTLDTPLTIDGTQQTTVEGALGGLNTKKINSSAIANNLTTTTSGKVLDARQGKVLNDALTIKSISQSDLIDVASGYTVYAFDAYEQAGIITMNLSVNATNAIAANNICAIKNAYIGTDNFGKIIGAGIARLSGMETGVAYPLGAWIMDNRNVFVQTTTACKGLSVHLQWKKP